MLIIFKLAFSSLIGYVETVCINSKGQFSPLNIAEQVSSLYAAVNGYLDKIEVRDINRYETDLLKLLNASHSDIMNAILDEKQLSKDIEAKLKTVVEDYTSSFV